MRESQQKKGIDKYIIVVKSVRIRCIEGQSICITISQIIYITNTIR